MQARHATTHATMTWRGMTRRGFGRAAAFALAAACAGRAAASPDDAAATVAELLDKAFAMLRETAGDAARREAGFRRLFGRYFDLPTIVRLVLGRHWRRATDAQKRAFAEVFEDHIVNIYASQLDGYAGEQAEVRRAVERTERDVIVSTEVRRAANPPLGIDWLVRRRESEYRVIDIAAEGVSMLTTKRSELAAVIAREGLDGLIARLRQLNAGGAEAL